MDNEAFDQFHQVRGQPWDRSLHVRLLNRLADDGCALVVMDSLFHEYCMTPPRMRPWPMPCAGNVTLSSWPNKRR